MKRFFLLLVLLAGCAHNDLNVEPLVSIQIQDRNGLTETISASERLKSFQETDFLSSQPYKKVLRVFKEGGKHTAKITSYHPNGLVWQYLEAQDMRALGTYKEWHANGRLKVEAQVIGGTADVTPGAQRDWLFDGLALVYDEQGNLSAKILYEKGVLEGKSLYFYPTGQLQKELPYHENELDGEALSFNADGTPLTKTTYQKGGRHGPSIGLWPDGKLCWTEKYDEGRLMEGRYLSRTDELVSEIQEGAGFQSLFEKTALREQIQYQKGKPEGVVKRFSPRGALVGTHVIHNGKKQGEEIQYDPETLLPKISIVWEEDAISGLVKTWYDNGALQSQREYSRNKKMGPSISWYRDGGLMLVEEYEEDRLVKGEYFKKKQETPVSTVINGNGVATLFDGHGIFLRKVHYAKGKAFDPEN